MATEEHMQIVLTRLGEAFRCRRCGTAIRFGDYECPHCGADLEDDLRDWAGSLLAELGLTQE